MARTASVVVVVFLSISPNAASLLAQAPSPDRALEATVLYGVNRDLPIAGPTADFMTAQGLVDVRVESEPTQWNVGLNIAGSPFRGLYLQSEILYNSLGESRISALVAPRVRSSVAIRANILEWTAGARVQVPAGSWRVQPFGAASVGVMRLKVEAEESDLTAEDDFTDVVYHFGFGARFFFTRAFGVAPEFRFVYLPDVSFHRVLIGAVFRVE